MTLQNAVRAVTWTSLMINAAFWLFFSPSPGWRRATYGVLASLVGAATVVSIVRAAIRASAA
jgi:hypothetical protein